MPSPASRSGTTSSDTSEPTDLAQSNELGVELRAVVGRLHRALRFQRRDDAVTEGQFVALGMLLRHGPMTPSAMAEHERMKPPSMTCIVGALADAGLVTKSDSPEDRRTVIVEISPRGREVLEETIRLRQEWLDVRLDQLDDSQRQILAAAVPVLRALVSAA